MNAPTSSNHLQQATFELLPIGAIAPSETQVQTARRAGYDPAALDELAKSIQADGVLQPIVVRPLPKDDVRGGFVKYELVAGERRWLAAQKVGHEHILSRICELSDVQVLNAQLVENIQRQGLDVLAEARGYRELIASGVNAETIADMIGKSRSYVYARTKLLALAPAVQEALRAGEIDASQALAFARTDKPKLQEQALKVLRNWSYQGHGEKLSFRRTVEILGDKMKGIFIPLAQVPWRLDDDSFYVFGPKDARGDQDMIPLPACQACPRRSGNDPELLAALDGDANVCTDVDCHNAKGKQTFERRKKQVEAEGREVLTGEAAAAIMPTQFGTRGWTDLDTECEDAEFPEPKPVQGSDESDDAFDQRMMDWDGRNEKWQRPSYRQLLGDDVAKLEIRLVQDPRNKTRLREMAPDKELAKLLKAKGVKVHIQRDQSARTPAAEKPRDPAAAQRQAEKEAQERAAEELDRKVEAETVSRLLKLVHEKWKGPMKRDDLELIAEYLQQDWDIGQRMQEVVGKRPTLAAMNERDLGRLIVSVVVMQMVEGEGLSALKATAKRLKLDPKAVEKEVRAELTKTEPAAPKKPAKKSNRK